MYQHAREPIWWLVQYTTSAGTLADPAAGVSGGCDATNKTHKMKIKLFIYIECLFIFTLITETLMIHVQVIAGR